MAEDHDYETKKRLSQADGEELKAVLLPTEEKICCPYCGSTNVYGISRVVGYYSIIDNWNKSKKAELKRRQKGNYWSNK